MNWKYIVLDLSGNPIARKGDEVNPYVWDSLFNVLKFAEEESKNGKVFIARLEILDEIGS